MMSSATGHPAPDDAYRVVHSYARGEIPRDEMIAVLAAWPYEEPRDLPPGPLGAWEDGVVLLPEGSFECTVGRAFDEGLLSSEDYHAIVDAMPE
jgi:hypothetical protein